MSGEWQLLVNFCLDYYVWIKLSFISLLDYTTFRFSRSNEFVLSCFSETSSWRSSTGSCHFLPACVGFWRQPVQRWEISQFLLVMLYSHVFPADLTVTYTVWFNFVLELPYIVKLRVNVGQIVVFLRTTRGCQATKQGIFPTGILLTYSSNAPLGGWKTKILV